MNSRKKPQTTPVEDLPSHHRNKPIRASAAHARPPTMHCSRGFGTGGAKDGAGHEPKTRCRCPFDSVLFKQDCAGGGGGEGSRARVSRGPSFKPSCNFFTAAPLFHKKSGGRLGDLKKKGGRWAPHTYTYTYITHTQHANIVLWLVGQWKNTQAHACCPPRRRKRPPVPLPRRGPTPRTRKNRGGSCACAPSRSFLGFELQKGKEKQRMQ